MTQLINYHPLRDDKTIQAWLKRILDNIKETQDKIDKLKSKEVK